MKDIILMAIMLMLAVGLCAQGGLFDLYYDAPLETAHQIMLENGFELFDSRANIGEYRSSSNIHVTNILLLVSPENKTLAGWLVKYSKENTAENDSYVLDTLKKLYGETNHYDTDTEQLIWFLTDARTVHVMYSEFDELIVLYYDSRFPNLFRFDK